MTTDLLKKISSWRKKKEQEYFLVVEEGKYGVQVSEGTVDRTEKRISIGGAKTVKDMSSVRRPFFFFDRLVIAFDSSHATTVENVVKVKRSKADRAIDETELDALVFKGLWEFLNHYRSWVAKKMGVSDLDLVLASIEIKDVHVGGHRLLNPIGFKGGDLSVRFRGTFVPRTLLPLLERFRGWADELVAVELGTTIAGTYLAPGDSFLDVREETTALFTAQEGEYRYHREIAWGHRALQTALALELGISEAVAEKFLLHAARGVFSERFGRFVDRVIREAFGGFLEGMQRTPGQGIGTKGKTFLSTRFVIPNLESLAKEPRLTVTGLDAMLRSQGFDITMRRGTSGFDPATRQEMLALLIYPYAHPHYAFLNQLLTRRAKWLIPHPSDAKG